MGCILALLLSLGPRIALLFMWLFTDRVTDAFNGFVLPLLGVLFLPFATLAYVLFWDPIDGLSIIGWLIVIVAFLIDLGVYAIGGFTSRQRLSGTDSN